MSTDKPHADVDFDKLATQATALAELNFNEAAKALGVDVEVVEVRVAERRHQELLATQYQLLALLERFAVGTATQLGAIVERLDRIERGGP